jgi:hypothetical protein
MLANLRQNFINFELNSLKICFNNETFEEIITVLFKISHRFFKT